MPVTVHVEYHFPSVLYLTEFCLMVYTQTIVFPAPSPAPGVVVPCVAIGPTRWLITFWAMPLVFDALTFLMTAYKSFEYWRMEVTTPMLTILFRDGLIYFTAIFAMNLLNVVLFTTMPPALQAVNLPATAMLGIIMSCRLVLNVRVPADQMAAGPSFKTSHIGTGQTTTLGPSTLASYQMQDFGKVEDGRAMMMQPNRSATEVSTNYEPRAMSVDRYSNDKAQW